MRVKDFIRMRKSRARSTSMEDTTALLRSFYFTENLKGSNKIRKLSKDSESG
jgi:hypothetical protein